MTIQTALAAPVRVHPASRNFYLAMSLACALTAFAGFAPTYFFRGLSGLPPLPVKTHIHGAAFTAWMLLLVAQTALVRADRRDLHRHLGTVGAALAAIMVWTGASAALDVAARFQTTGFLPHGMTPVAFLAIQLGMLAQFAVFIALAVGMRHRSEVHKRLMLLATISILPPAIARLHLENYGLSMANTATLVAYLLVVVAVSYDFARMRHVHPTYLWGGPAMLAWMFLRAAIGRAEWWQPIGQWLLS